MNHIPHYDKMKLGRPYWKAKFCFSKATGEVFVDVDRIIKYGAQLHTLERQTILLPKYVRSKLEKA